MTFQLKRRMIVQLREAWKDNRFRHAYTKFLQHEIFRRRSGRNLLVFSLLYASVLVFIGAIVF